MAKKKKNKAAQPAPAPARPAASSDNKIVAIGAAVIGLIVLVVWVTEGNRSRAPEPEERPRPEHPVDLEDSGPIDPRLMHPERLTATAPATFAVEMETSAGTFVIDVTRAWSPNGADRFYNLVQNGYFTNVAFFRVIDGFMAQTGIHGRPEVARAWRDANIQDDPVVQHNTRGFVSFATAGPNTRTTQFFINFGDNSRLDGSGFSPFGRVRDMGVVDRLEDRYGEGAPQGMGPDQQRVQMEGNAYLRTSFPDLDYIESARVL